MTSQETNATNLRVAMTGKASDAKTADGDAPVFAYIASLPQPQRGIAEQIDALAARTLPDLRRAVKWGMAYYGVDGGWCFASGAFVGNVKLMFIRGTELEPEPPVTPIGMGKQTRVSSWSPSMISMNSRSHPGCSRPPLSRSPVGRSADSIVPRSFPRQRSGRIVSIAMEMKC
jgi:hypothetical protein